MQLNFTVTWNACNTWPSFFKLTWTQFTKCIFSVYVCGIIVNDLVHIISKNCFPIIFESIEMFWKWLKHLNNLNELWSIEVFWILSSWIFTPVCKDKNRAFWRREGKRVSHLLTDLVLNIMMEWKVEIEVQFYVGCP